jgi:phosphonate transport system substrate-binding protein
MMKKGLGLFMGILMIFGFFSVGQAAPKQKLVFGAIAVGKVSKVRQSLQPLMSYLEKKTGATITFETGKDYPDTIEQFQSGYFDFGYIGPSPYVIATSGEKGRAVFNIIAGLETKHKPFFHAVIIAAKNNDAINSLQDLKGKSFAFGSRQSTLSCYMPCKMLMDAGIFDTLSKHDFLGKHDKVAQYVAMGGFDAGGIKEAVAQKNLDKIKVIATSEPVYDFLLVAHHTMDRGQYDVIKAAVLELKDPAVLDRIKKGVTAFIETSDARYDNLRSTMATVDQKLGQ